MPFSGTLQQPVRGLVIRHVVRQAPGRLERDWIIRADCESFLVVRQCIFRVLRRFKQPAEADIAVVCIGSVAAGNQQFRACILQFVLVDEIAREFFANGNTVLDTVPLVPGAVDCSPVVVHGIRVISFVGRQARELEVDIAVARSRLPQTEEVVVGLVDETRLLLLDSGVAQRLRQQQFIRAGPGSIEQSRAQIDNGFRGAVRLQGSAAAIGPALGKVCAMGSEGTEQKQGNGEEQSGDQQKAEHRYGVTQHQPPPRDCSFTDVHDHICSDAALPVYRRRAAEPAFDSRTENF